MRLQSGGDQAHLFLGLGSSFQAPSGCWQNSVSCSFRTEVPAFLQAVSSGCSQVLKAICGSSPSHSPPPTWQLTSSSRRMSLLRKDPIPLFKNFLLIKSSPLKLINRLGMLNSICKILSLSPNTVT